MRGVRLRWPLRTLRNGRPISLLDDEAKAYFLAAGYAVVTIDVRGTGASFGQWRMPWGFEERRDTAEVLEWIIGQRWSDRQVSLMNLPYINVLTTS